MDAAAAISWSNPSRRMPLLRNRVFNGAALALSWAMALPAAFLLCRRLAGSLTAPLSAPLLIAVGLIAVATAVAVQLLSQTPPEPRRTTRLHSQMALARSDAGRRNGNLTARQFDIRTIRSVANCRRRRNRPLAIEKKPPDESDSRCAGYIGPIEQCCTNAA